MLGTVPPGSLEATRIPAQPDKYNGQGLYLANFSAVGQQIQATGPGVALISTVPGGANAPYMVMSGTSLACPAATAALASLLSGDQAYLSTSRGPTRAQAAYDRFRQTLRNIGLSPIYQGGGLATAAAS
jgi:subtilisin